MLPAMNRRDMRKLIFTVIAYTVVACIGYIVVITFMR
jgi:hypothetical protein